MFSRLNSGRCAAARHLLLGVRDDVRVAGYQDALRQAGLPAAAVIDYRDLVMGGNTDAWLQDASLLRIESPGRDFAVYKALLAYGYETACDAGVPVIEPSEIGARALDKGELLCPTQFFHGFERVMMDVASSLSRRPQVDVTSHPDDICIVYDKRRCHRMLRDAGIPVPRTIVTREPIRSYDDLRDAMAAARIRRVFVKLRYGSSAAGVMAYQAAEARELAITTAELVRRSDGTAAVYSTRRLQRYEVHRDIRLLMNALIAHDVHVEAWVPKASIGPGICDLRVLTIAGEPRHMVVRRSRSPITNLHLLNERCEVDALRRRMSKPAWESLLDTCRRVAALLPRTLHLGIDVAVKVGFRDHAVLEVNAFGDLLKGVTDRGLTTYEAEVEALRPRLEAMA